MPLPSRIRSESVPDSKPFRSAAESLKGSLLKESGAMHIALVIYGSLNEVSGGFLYDRKLVEHLQQRGHEVTVISLPWRSYG